MIRQKHPSASRCAVTVVNNCSGPSGEEMPNPFTSFEHANVKKINGFKGHDQLQIIPWIVGSHFTNYQQNFVALGEKIPAKQYTIDFLSVRR